MCRAAIAEAIPPRISKTASDDKKWLNRYILERCENKKFAHGSWLGLTTPAIYTHFFSQTAGNKANAARPNPVRIAADPYSIVCTERRKTATITSTSAKAYAAITPPGRFASHIAAKEIATIAKPFAGSREIRNAPHSRNGKTALASSSP